MGRAGTTLTLLPKGPICPLPSADFSYRVDLPANLSRGHLSAMEDLIVLSVMLGTFLPLVLLVAACQCSVRWRFVGFAVVFIILDFYLTSYGLDLQEGVTKLWHWNWFGKLGSIALGTVVLWRRPDLRREAGEKRFFPWCDRGAGGRGGLVDPRCFAGSFPARNHSLSSPDALAVRGNCLSRNFARPADAGLRGHRENQGHSHLVGSASAGVFSAWGMPLIGRMEVYTSPWRPSSTPVVWAP